MKDNAFLTGVIEGFYGQPWSLAERLQLFDWMAALGLNTYLYAPKDDLKHRALWRNLYSNSEADSLRELIRVCESRGLRFIYALSPGLDIRYSDQGDLDGLKGKFEQMLSLGCGHFALLFDDIPDSMSPEDQRGWSSFAAAQCHVTNRLFEIVRKEKPGARFLFCPTPYCGRMAKNQLGGGGYLETLGRTLSPGIDVFWTGPEIISQNITADHAREIAGLLQRKPLIWDNLHANDYDGRRFYCGPYSGRPPELKLEVAGILTNPNNEFPLNFVPLRTLAAYLECGSDWNPRQAYLSAVSDWTRHFNALSGSLTVDDLALLGDCFYLPHEDGPLAGQLFSTAQQALSGSGSAAPGSRDDFIAMASRLRNICARLAELEDRPLFYALSRRIWELREELDLLLVCARRAGAGEDDWRSDFHLPGTYRGGFVARLQHLLRQHPDGTFAPAPDFQQHPENV